MVDFWRFSAGIVFVVGSHLLQLPLLASEPLNNQATTYNLRNSSQSGFNSTIKVQFPKHLIAQERQGERQEFKIPTTGTEFMPSIPIEEIEVVEVIADLQEYDRSSEIITAEGNVVMRFAQSVMTSDRLEINLKDRIAVATGNVVLKRGEQILRGNRFEYYLVADRGVIFNAGGEIFQPSLIQDTDIEKQLAPNKTILDRALSDRLIDNQPLTNVTATEGFNTTVGSSRDVSLIDGDNSTGGKIDRLRFEAERIDFEGSEWTASNLSLTNDPFSPPELELRAAKASFERLNSLQNKLTTRKSRLVIDDSFTVPLLLSAFVFDNRPTRPGIFNIAFDGEERGGLYIERSWSVLNRGNFNWELTPQYFLQRALFPTTFDFSESNEGGLFNSAVFGLKNRINFNFTARTSLNHSFSLTSFDLGELEDNFRANIALQQIVGNPQNPYQFALEYNYRDRLFNGSLGFQTVRSSIGGVVTSPNIAIANTGINFRYQASIQNINSDTDRQDLLETDPDNERINLTRYQGAIFINKNFSIWTGKPLPSTRQKALRYSPVPVVPYLQLVTGVQGVASFYSNGDRQDLLEGTIGLQGQLGHFSRSWLDYTGFRLGYSQNIRGDESPFLFDRIVDRQKLDLGLTQQIYGPFRLGFNTSLDLNDRDEISTDYILEYSRRTHNIVLRYNPVLELGSFSLRISDFDWEGNPQPFRDEVTPVIQGVEP